MRASNERWVRSPITLSLGLAAIGVGFGSHGISLGSGSAWVPGAERASQMMGIGLAASLAAIALSLVGWRWVAPFRGHRRRRDIADEAVTMLAALALSAMTIQQYAYSRLALAEFSEAAAAEAHTSLVRAMPDGRSLLMGATMVRGATDRVRELLDANPGVGTLFLFGPGGSQEEGFAMATLVAERRLRTVALSTCASACTLPFLAGRPRLLVTRRDGLLGFHAGSYIEGNTRVRADDPGLLLAYMMAGLPPAFVEKALSTPFDGIWTPGYDELVQAKVIDGVLDPSELSALHVSHDDGGRDGPKALEASAPRIGVP